MDRYHVSCMFFCSLRARCSVHIFSTGHDDDFNANADKQPHNLCPWAPYAFYSSSLIMD